jgi:magnesium chelatase family protein
VSSACAWSVALVGLEGRIVEVEADIGAGLPRTVLLGLPDSALYQARDRCKAAVSNSSQEWPISLLTINLSPATLPKAGSHYDLAIVAAVSGGHGHESNFRALASGQLGAEAVASGMHG